jgi:hypothetical protein
MVSSFGIRSSGGKAAASAPWPAPSSLRRMFVD